MWQLYAELLILAPYYFIISASEWVPQSRLQERAILREILTSQHFRTILTLVGESSEVGRRRYL